MHYFIRSNWGGQEWPSNAPGPIDSSSLCYEARAQMLYKDWGSFNQQHQSPYYNDYSTALDQAFPGFWTSHQYSTGLGINRYMTNTGKNIAKMKQTVEDMMAVYDTPALDAAGSFITELVGNSSQILIPIPQEAANDPGLYSASQLTYGLANWLKTQVGTFYMTGSTNIGDFAKNNIDPSKSSLSTAFTSAIGSFESDIQKQWGDIYSGGREVDGKLAAHVVSINTTLHNTELADNAKMNMSVRGVAQTERGLNSSSIAGSASLVAPVSQLRAALGTVLSPPTIDMLTMVPGSAKTAVATTLTNAINNINTWLQSQVDNKKKPFTPTVTQATTTTRNLLSGNLGSFVTKANEAGFNSTLKVLLNNTDKAFLKNSVALNMTAIGLPGSVSGRVEQLGNATASATIISDYVSAASTFRSTQSEKSNDLSGKIDTASTRMSRQIQDGTMSSSLFQTLHGSVSDIYTQRYSLMKSAKGDVDQMTALVTSLAASVGMNISTFMNELLTAQKAIKNLASSSSSADPSSTASSIGKSAMTKLQNQAVAATKAAQKGQSSISSIATSLATSMNDASLSASAQAAKSMGFISNANSQLSQSNSKVTSSVTAAAADNLSTVKILSGVLSASQQAANALTSKISVVGSSGQQQMSMSGSAISKSFAGILDSIQSVLTQLKTQYSKSSNELLGTKSAPLTAIVTAAETAVGKLKAVAAGLEADLKSVTDKIGFAGVSDTFNTVANEINTQRGKMTTEISGRLEGFKESGNSTLLGQRGTVAKEASSFHSSKLSLVKDVAGQLSGASEAVITRDANKWQEIAFNLGNASLGVSPRNNTYLRLSPFLASLRGLLTGDNAILSNDNTASGRVAQAAAQVIRALVSDHNSTLGSRLTELHQQSVSNISKLSTAVSQAKVNVSGADQLATLVNGIKELMDAQPTSQLASARIGQAIIDLVDGMNTSSTRLEEATTDFLANKTLATELAVLVPYFALADDVRDYARQATAGISSSSLMSQQVAAASSGLIAGLYDAAQSAQKQGAIALAMSQADAAGEVKQSDIEQEVNAKLSAAAADAASDAVKGFNKQLDLAVTQGKLNAQEAELQLALVNATWKSQSAGVAQNISSGLSNTTRAIAGALEVGAKAVTQNIMSDVMKQWTEYTSGDMSTIASVPVQANSGVITLQGAVQSKAAGSESEIANLLNRVESMISAMSTLRVTGDSLSQFPSTAGGSLDTARSALDELNTVSVAHLKRSIADLIQERRAQAAANILELYSSMSSLVGKTQATAIRLAQFSTSE